MAAAGSNNVYVDIIFRLQAQAAMRAERIIARLIKRGQLATETLKKFEIPDKLTTSTVRAANEIRKLSQKATESARAQSDLWRGAVAPLRKEFERLAEETEAEAAQLEYYSRMQWDAIKADKNALQTVRKLGATEENYREVLSAKASELQRAANLYRDYGRDLEEGGRLLRQELINQRKLWRIYQLTGVRLDGLRSDLVGYAKVLDSILPMSERTWKPTAKDIKALAGGLTGLSKSSARTLMQFTRNAAVARALGEEMAIIDAKSASLLRTLSPLNYQIANMGIIMPITTDTAQQLAQGTASVTKAAKEQALALAKTAASFDMLALPAERNAVLGSQLYDIFTGNSRMALEVEDSVRAATGVLDKHARGLHLVNRALRAQNANFAITQETINRITKEGWGAFTEEQKKALQAIKKNYETTLEYTGVLDTHERALLRVIRRTETMDRALHFQLKTAEDAAFLLKRLQTEGYDALTEAEKKAIEELEKNIAQTWTWDSRTKTLAQRIIATKNAYTQQRAILSELTPRQRAFYGTIYRLQMGMSKLSRFIDRVSIGSLKLLGPIFLATAAINTFSRIIGACVDSFTNYENALMDLRVSGGLTVETTNRLSQVFTSLERILPISATQLLSIARAAAKAGVTGEVELKRFTVAIAKFTQVTGWSAEEASDALLKISRAFNIPIESAEHLASMMHYLAIVSVADADDIVKAMARVGASAVNLGIAAEEAAAMATTLIDAGMSARRAGTRLRAFMREFLKKGDKIAEVMKNAGKEFANFGEVIRANPAKALKMFLKYLASIDDEAQRAQIVYKIFGSVAGFAVLTLAEHYPLLEERMKAAHREMVYGSRLSKDFSKWMDATSISLKKASNSFDRLKRSIGAALGPPLAAAANWLSGIIEDLFPSARRGIQVMTEGTQEWIELFEKGAPAAEKLARRVLLTEGRLPQRHYRYRRDINKLIEEGTTDYINYVETVTSGADDIFARTGDIIDLLEKEGKDVKYLRNLEGDYYDVTEDIRQARTIACELEHKYGRERLKHLNAEIKAGRQVTDASQEEIEAAKEWGRMQDFIRKKDEERARIKLDLIYATRQAAETAKEEGGIEWKNLKVLDDYTTHIKYFDRYLGDVNDKEALSLALLTKYGPLYQDLKRNIPAKDLQDFSRRLDDSIKSGRGAGPVIRDFNDYLQHTALD